MTVFETLTLMIAFASLVVVIIRDSKNNRHPR